MLRLQNHGPTCAGGLVIGSIRGLYFALLRFKQKIGFLWTDPLTSVSNKAGDPNLRETGANHSSCGVPCLCFFSERLLRNSDQAIMSAVHLPITHKSKMKADKLLYWIADCSVDSVRYLWSWIAVVCLSFVLHCWIFIIHDRRVGSAPLTSATLAASLLIGDLMFYRWNEAVAFTKNHISKNKTSKKN